MGEMYRTRQEIEEDEWESYMEKWYQERNNRLNIPMTISQYDANDNEVGRYTNTLKEMFTQIPRFDRYYYRITALGKTEPNKNVPAPHFGIKARSFGSPYLTEEGYYNAFLNVLVKDYKALLDRIAEGQENDKHGEMIDVLISLNDPSKRKLENRIVSGGIMIYNTNMVLSAPTRDDIIAIGIPATELAEKCGANRAANMIILAYFTRLTGIVPIETMHRIVDKEISQSKPQYADINNRAFEAGVKEAENTLSSLGKAHIII